MWLKMHLDVGFAYDGDADRCLAVDSEGKLVDGDKILYVCGKYMKEQDTLVNNTVVTTVMSNFGLYKAFEREGISYEKTAVGDKYVYENMSAERSLLGRRAVGPYHFQQARDDRRWHFNIIKADGSDSGEERNTCKAG